MGHGQKKKKGSEKGDHNMALFDLQPKGVQVWSPSSIFPVPAVLLRTLCFRLSYSSEIFHSAIRLPFISVSHKNSARITELFLTKNKYLTRGFCRERENGEKLGWQKEWGGDCIPDGK